MTIIGEFSQLPPLPNSMNKRLSPGIGADGDFAMLGDPSHIATARQQERLPVEERNWQELVFPPPLTSQRANWLAGYICFRRVEGRLCLLEHRTPYSAISWQAEHRRELSLYMYSCCQFELSQTARYPERRHNQNEHVHPSPYKGNPGGHGEVASNISRPNSATC